MFWSSDQSQAVASTLTQSQRRKQTKYLQVRLLLNRAPVPLRSLSLPEATAHQAGDREYRVKEQVGQDSGPGDPAISHISAAHALRAAAAQHSPLRE